MTEKLWTKNFLLIIWSYALMYGGFHALLPTIPVYAAQNGGTGTQLGIIGGIFGISAIIIRFFAVWGAKKIGGKNCLLIGLVVSFLSMIGYSIFFRVDEIIAIRTIHGFGYGLATTFFATLATDIIPRSRRGEGMGYFGLGSTAVMVVAPAFGVWVANSYSFDIMFTITAASQLAAILLLFCMTSVATAAAVPAKQDGTSILDNLIEKGLMFPAFLTMLFGVGYGSVNIFVAMVAQEAHIVNPGYFFFVGAIWIFLSRPIAGKVFDRKGPAWVILPGAVFLFFGLFIISKTTSLTLFLIAGVCYGFG